LPKLANGGANLPHHQNEHPNGGTLMSRTQWGFGEFAGMAEKQVKVIIKTI